MRPPSIPEGKSTAKLAEWDLLRPFLPSIPELMIVVDRNYEVGISLESESSFGFSSFPVLNNSILKCCVMAKLLRFISCHHDLSDFTIRKRGWVDAKPILSAKFPSTLGSRKQYQVISWNTLAGPNSQDRTSRQSLQINSRS